MSDTNRLNSPSNSSSNKANNSVYERILREIENGTLKPGDRLREAELAKRINVSRTPIREALHLLEADGLVSHLPRQGASVRELCYAEVMELYDMRVVLECAAARLAARAASELELHHLQIIHSKFAATKDTSLAAKINQEFHYALLQASKNRFLSQSNAGLHKTLLLLGGTTLEDEVRMTSAVEEHERILSSLNARDPDLAEQTMRTHIEAAQKKRIQTLFESQRK